MFHTLLRINLIVVLLLIVSCGDGEDARIVSGFSVMQVGYTTYVKLPAAECNIPFIESIEDLTNFISNQDGYVTDRSVDSFLTDKCLVLISCVSKKSQYNYFVIVEDDILKSGSGDGAEVKKVRELFFEEIETGVAP